MAQVAWHKADVITMICAVLATLVWAVMTLVRRSPQSEPLPFFLAVVVCGACSYTIAR